jgi:beta-galactosidase
MVKDAATGKVLDTYKTPFGIRRAEFTLADGFHLNGARVPLNGVCMHHDLGALGSAINTRALERQLDLLLLMGANAIRTSHNPPAPELLALADKKGILVIDEFADMWERPKKRNGYSSVFKDWSEADLRTLVKRDRNHPSVIAWSTGNEVFEQSGGQHGLAVASRLSKIAREADPTRPTTSGNNNPATATNGFQKTSDIYGYNYRPNAYNSFRKSNPDIPVYGSETSSCVSSRGEYFFPVQGNKAAGRSDFHVSSYDLYAPPWAFPPDTEFAGLDKAPLAAGEFVWTGFDYLGEPTPYGSDVSNLLNFHSPEDKARAADELKRIGKLRVPSRSSYFGIIDLAGFPKDRFYIYQARWRPDLPLAHILPHWNWPERLGETTPVHVYSSGDEAELFLNNTSLGRKKRGRYEYRFRWDDVKYAPGELRVVTWKNGKPWATATRQTTGDAAKLILEPDRPALRADGADLLFVTVRVADAQNRTAPRAKNPVKFTLTGPGEIVATDNGDPTDHALFSSRERKAFNGLALAIIRAKRNQTAPLSLRAESPDLTPAEITIPLSPPSP